jgi:hypothetical protein
MTIEALEEKHKDILFCGIECNSGWYDLVDECLTKLKTIYPKIKICQIKEKFGGLRVYEETIYSEINLDRDKIFESICAVIDIYEAKSYEICEVCSKPGVLRTKGHRWIRTLCDEHESSK